VVPGKLASAFENYFWVQASLELLRQFYEYGGQRIVMAGTCFEYDLQYGYCSEFRTSKAPSTYYGKCKNALQILLDAYSDRVGLSSAWGRIFFLYGPHEYPTRLVPSVIRSILRGEPALCSHGNQIRDYLHVEDIADAFVTLLESDVTGHVNIASGHPVTLKDIIYKIAKTLNGTNLVRLGALPATPNDMPLVVADVGRLFNEVGWKPNYELDRGLKQTINWWREQLKQEGTKQT